MTPQMAFAEAMKFENRANPYPFFDELRKTPVVRADNGVYAVSGYPEIIALAHDPRVSSDLRNSPLGLQKSGKNIGGESSHWAALNTGQVKEN